MKKNIFNVIIISIISVFIITFAATGYVLYSDYKTGLKAAETRFEKLFTQTEDAITKHSVPNSEFFKDFSKAVGSPEYYYSIRLKNYNRDIYSYPSSIQTGSKLFTVTKSRRITEGALIDFTLTASIYTLPSAIIYARIKIAFIVILATTLASALCLIYLYVNGSDDDSEEFNFSKIDEETVTEKEADTEENDEFNFDIDIPQEEDLTVEDKDKTIVEESTVLVDSNVQSVETTPALQEAPVNSVTEEISEEPALATSEVSETQLVQEESTSEMFSPKTGFCYEKYLNTRLDSELSRASSSEIDISLVLIRIPGLKIDSNCGVDICKKILDIFHYRDMLFEYGTDGLAVIFSNADIDKAMESSESIYAEITAILNNSGLSYKPLFGIASRSLRFISGSRIIAEAEQAVIHASEEQDSPIIAFRVNPEKYRKYMASREEQ